MQRAFFLLFFIFTALFLDAKDYSIVHLNINAYLEPNGSINVSESRTFVFDGDFSSCSRFFPSDERTEFGDFSVSENNTVYAQSASKEPFTYSLEKTRKGTELRWFFNADDETKTFMVGYRVKNLVTVWDDAALLKYQFISEDWQKDQKNVTLRIHAPILLQDDELLFWTRSINKYTWEILADGTVRIFLPVVKEKSFLEVTALYPVYAFPEAVSNTGSIETKIVQEETKLQSEQKYREQIKKRKELTRQKRFKWGKWAILVLSLLNLYIWWALYTKSGRLPNLSETIPVNFESPPDKTPPALVEYLLSARQVTGASVVSTIYQLASLGIITFEKQDDTYYWCLQTEKWEELKKSILPYEMSLINFLFKKLGKNDRLAVKTLKERQGKYLGFFERWQKVVIAEGKKQKWYDETSLKATGYSYLNSLVGLSLGFFTVLFLGPWGMVVVISSLITLLLSTIIPHRTYEGELLAAKWSSFGTFLRSIKHDDTKHLSSYMIYAPVLNIDDDTIEKFMQKVDKESLQKTYSFCFKDGFDPVALQMLFALSVYCRSNSYGSGSHGSSDGSGIVA